MKKVNAGTEDVILDELFPKLVDKYDPEGNDSKSFDTLEDENRRQDTFDNGGYCHHCDCDPCHCGEAHEHEGEAKIDGSKLLSLFENVATPAFEELMDSLKHEGGDDTVVVKKIRIDDPFEVLESEDFDRSCPVIKQLEDGLGCEMPDALHPLFDWEELQDSDVERLASTYKAFVGQVAKMVLAQKLSNLRIAFSYLQKCMSDPDNTQYKYKALTSLRTAQKYSRNTSEVNEINKAIDSVLKGSVEFIDAAKFRTHNIFANNVSTPNIRVAYTTIATQPGEDFLMCPKGLDMLGYPVPMEISKCRDNCIDSRMNRESGAIHCGYKNWINTVADSNKKALARLEVHRHPDNEANLLNLNGKRTKEDSHVTNEVSMENLKLNNKAVEKPYEELLESHHRDSERLQEQKDSKTEAAESISVDARNTNDKINDDSYYGKLEKNHKDLTDEEVNLALEQWLESTRKEKK